MAKVVSPVWSSIRGSICGTTYLTTAAGQIIARQRTRPTQTPSNFRTYIKNAMQLRAQHWNALTQAQRNAWDVWAQANHIVNGRQAYLQGTVPMQFLINTGLAGVLTGMSDTAPVTNNFPQCSIGTTAPIIAGTDAVAVKITNNGPQRVAVYVQISPGLNATRHFWKGPWNDLRSIGMTINSGSSAVQEFSLLNLGQRYFIRVRPITADVGVGLTGNTVAVPMYTDSIAVHVP